TAVIASDFGFSATDGVVQGEFIPAAFKRRGKNDTPPSVWELDVSQPGNFCYFVGEESKVSLWRSDASKTSLLFIQNGVDEYKMSWRATRHTRVWPQKKIELISGEYLIGIGDALNQVIIQQISKPADSSKEAVAQVLREAGCTQQAEMLDKTDTNLSI
ncbi:hypothetical protein, partial [Candidatus Parabeggiatoa sp. HSG14]|uniref:hypothetical protein n=1 Tax=Candidatus Parabeggiatoa sp. HSG14 TaxID=3055593 RepID=UPI0025A6DE33|nr:hypothetical protein [Thiotrichales bacterium HSG14]